MIANAYLNKWRQTVPWSDDRMVEQDLISSRLFVESFNHPKISDSLAFRGSTAIYKLFTSHPVRYSEDIDLVQIKAEPIDETITAIRSIVDPMLIDVFEKIIPLIPGKQWKSNKANKEEA